MTAIELNNYKYSLLERIMEIKDMDCLKKISRLLQTIEKEESEKAFQSGLYEALDEARKAKQTGERLPDIDQLIEEL